MLNGTLIDQSKPVLVAGLQADTLAPATDGSDQAQESTVNMDWSGLPSACTKPTKITPSNRFLHGDFAVASTYATSSGTGRYVNVNLASFKMDPKRLYDGPRGKQFALELSLGSGRLHTGLRLAALTAQALIGFVVYAFAAIAYVCGSGIDCF